jgi:conjugative transfer signal peptidase TraF
MSLPEKLIYNASASAPTGVYWLDNRPIERGDYVLVRVPERVRKLVEERGYLPADVPLIKRVVGAGGDEICRLGREIRINGETGATALTVDGAGRLMPAWQGCYVLSSDRVFLLQDHPHSFDGRYFGPVHRRLIIGRATRLRLPWRPREES